MKIPVTQYDRIKGRSLKQLARELVFRSYDADYDAFFPDDHEGGTRSFSQAVVREMKFLESPASEYKCSGQKRYERRIERITKRRYYGHAD